jgi:hypothetical protein
MVRQNNAPYRATLSDLDFKSILLGTACDRAHHCKAANVVVDLWRENHGRSSACLLVSHLRIEIHPNDIACVRDVLSVYHSSFPTRAPQSVSGWRFSFVIPRINSFRVGLRFFFFRVSEPERSTSKSRSSPTLSFAASAAALGMRTARLFPHFAICAFMATRIYTVYTLVVLSQVANSLRVSASHSLAFRSASGKMPPTVLPTRLTLAQLTCLQPFGTKRLPTELLGGTLRSIVCRPRRTRIRG